MANDNDGDIFHAVTMAEDSTWHKSYEEGIEEGRKKGFIEGFSLGTQKGTELGKEVGFYAGYANYVFKLYKDDPKKLRLIKLCQSIVTMAGDISHINPQDESLTEILSKLQSKFKQVTSLLGVKVEYKATDGTSTAISF